MSEAPLYWIHLFVQFLPPYRPASLRFRAKRNQDFNGFYVKAKARVWR